MFSILSPKYLKNVLKMYTCLMTLKPHCLWWFVNMQLGGYGGYNNYVRIQQTSYPFSNNLEKEKILK